MNKINFVIFAVLLILLAACGGQKTSTETSPAGNAGLSVVATTSIVGDVVAQVGGEYIDLKVLLPVGTDPHSYSPTPQDAAMLADADVVFANGAGLESFLGTLLESAGATDKLVTVSDGITLLEGTGDAHGHGADPHTWTDPNNVKIWVNNIQKALSTADSKNATVYQSNADTYLKQLDELDGWIRGQVALIPEGKRSLVTDHMEQGYFAQEYGFNMVGALIPGYSTLSEPAAKDLAAIEDAIRSLGVTAVFVGNTVNPNLAERVAVDTGTQLVYIYSGSLSPADGEAATYLDYMRYNVNAIVGALK
ncbi:MAG: metal ABC transporter substrate-binding protein [Chloroflexi bacterium]|nr:metal ABC transporter substrate-binding protein [Chloroflexota bacterium]